MLLWLVNIPSFTQDSLDFFSTWLPGVEQAQSSGQKSVSAKLEHQMSELKPFGGRCF
jgi:hypothetical protein